MCLPYELTSSAALSVWVALGELHMKPWCTICLLLTLVAVLSGSFLQCMLKGKGHLIFVRLIPKGSGDGDEVLSVPPLHAPLQKVYKPYWHLGLLHFSLSKDWFSLWSVTKDCPSVLILQVSTRWCQVWNTCLNTVGFELFLYDLSQTLPLEGLLVTSDR